MRTSRISTVVAAVAVVSLAGPALAASAEVDPTFGDGGVTVVPLHAEGGTTFQVTDASIAADGSVALVGAVLELGVLDGVIPDIDIDLAVARLDSAGRPDGAFGDGGVVRIDAGGLDLPVGVAPDSAGRIVFSGNRLSQEGESGPVVGRLTAAGALDATYGEAGLVTLPTAAVHFAGGLSVDDEGRAAVAAILADDAEDDDSAAAVVTRLTADGDLDQTFGTEGTTTVAPTRAGAFGIGAAADGGYLVAGIAVDEGFVARIGPTGTLDPDFGSGGITSVPVPRSVGMAVQETDAGDVVVGGIVGFRTGMLARLDADGNLDLTFGRGGVRTVRSEDAGPLQVARIAPGPGGALAFTGPQIAVTPSATVGRVLASGRLDAGFGGDGYVHPLEGAADTGLSVGSAITADATGRLVVGGVIGRTDAADAFAARLQEVQPGAAVSGADVTRIAGVDRVATSIELSNRTFAADGEAAGRNAGAVVLAAAGRFPDALVAAPYAAAFEAPLLLNPTDALDARVRGEVERLLAPGGQVTLMGGIAALGPAVEAELRAAGYDVVRIAGEDRYDTSVRVAEALSPAGVLLARGDAFPDALAAGPAAAEIAGAVLLTAGAQVPSPVRAYLDAQPDLQRFAVGGRAAAADPGATPVVGADRYATAALVADRFFVTPPRTVVASGEAFPDALAGGARAALSGSPLLLTLRDRLPGVTAAVLRAIGPFHQDVAVAGGSAVITDGVVRAVTEAAAG